MRLIISLFIVGSIFLAGCVYHQPIEQGNVLSAKKAATVKMGMTKSQVVTTLGHPVMENMYKDNRLVYVYTLQTSPTHMNKNRFIVTFRNNRVIKKKYD